MIINGGPIVVLGKIIGSIVFLGLLLELCAFVAWNIHIGPVRSRHRTSVAPFLSQYNSRLISYQSNKMFQVGEERRNAGVFLNRRVVWKVRGKPARFDDLHAEIFSLQRSGAARIFHAKENWPRKLTPSDFPMNDFAWMKRLRDYDHWNLDSDSSRFRHFKANGSVVDMPSPMLEGFANLGKVRLTQSRNAAETVDAIADIQQLARLLITTQSAEGALTAARILRDIVNYVKVYQVLNPSMIPPDLEIIPLDEIDSFENSVRLNLSTFHLMTPSDIFLNTYGIPGSNSSLNLETRTRRHSISICPAINNNVVGMKYYEPLLKSVFANRYVLMKLVIGATKGTCRTSFSHAYLDRKNIDIYRNKQWLQLVPVGKWAVGGFFSSLSWPIFRPTVSLNAEPVGTIQGAAAVAPNLSR